VASRSEPRSYPYPPQQVFAAALAGLPATTLRIVGADPTQGTIWTDRSTSAFSWGEKVTIYVYQGDQGQAAVVVDSALKFGLFSWGAHQRNHQTVFAAIEQGLGVAPPAAAAPQAPAPAPYPPPPQPERPAEPEPPPGAVRF
jgi:hypothetical protein